MAASDEVRFYPLDAHEQQSVQNRGLQPAHRDFSCGACGEATNGRAVASVKRSIDGATVWYCVCSCPQREATVLLERGGSVVAQIPEAREYHPGEKWPPDLAQLFDEAGRAFAAGAYTAVAMVCRKALMACACHEGDTDGKSFTAYVDFIIGSVLTFPKAKDAIDKLRTIGNEANHKIRFVSRDDARRALDVVKYMLNTIYSIPTV